MQRKLRYCNWQHIHQDCPDNPSRPERYSILLNICSMARASIATLIVVTLWIIYQILSYIGVDPIHKTAVVVMQNSFNWDNTVGHKLLLDLRYRPDLACF